MGNKDEKKYLIDNPALMAEWNWEKNNNLGLDPKKLTCGSGRKAWWKCSKDGYEWDAIIAARNKGTGCPVCAGKKVLVGINDLATVNPQLAKEWNYEKNGNSKPEVVTAGSGKKVWWRCSKGHEWQSTIAHRNNGRGCPVCSLDKTTSLPEYAILYYLEKNGLKAIHLYKEKGYELDIYIPSKKIAIEYDGNLWHKNKAKKDLDKNLNCKRDGIQLYRIREGLPVLNDTSIDFVIDKNQKELSNVIKKILSIILETNVDVDLKRDAIEIENLREYSEKANSLLVLNPELAKEWNYEKNGNLKPENFLPNSNKKVWWRCSENHEWEETIINRNNGDGCPYCSGHKVLAGFNDLATVNPKLAKEWNYEKNGNSKPEGVTANSNKKVWWRCSKGHEWQSTVANRNNGRGCPVCAGKKVLVGVNDLATVNPELAKEWNYDKNSNSKPEGFIAGSGKKVWWKCSKGHEWQATIIKRNNGTGCPVCAGKKVLVGVNDLATVNPKLAKEWNYEKNGNSKPEGVAANSNKKVWWRCSKDGYEWDAIIADRNKGTGCPVCAGRKVVVGVNDLVTVNPKLAKEWNYEKNDTNPEDFTAGSGKKVWWKCSKGHEWKTSINSRNSGHGCPVCAKQKTTKQ
ncbi:MAG: hypothetical protein J6B16_03975 [Clostridia bacterium]|nr:hypothetical protein [Clostridia bacterium]